MGCYGSGDCGICCENGGGCAVGRDEDGNIILCSCVCNDSSIIQPFDCDVVEEYDWEDQIQHTTFELDFENVYPLKLGQVISYNIDSEVYLPIRESHSPLTIQEDDLEFERLLRFVDRETPLRIEAEEYSEVKLACRGRDPFW